MVIPGGAGERQPWSRKEEGEQRKKKLGGGGEGAGHWR